MMHEMKVFGLTIDPFTSTPIVILKDLDEKSALPIWIGILEASAIASELENIELPRPMTHDLIRNILLQINASIVCISVIDLKDNVYYANIHLEMAKRRYIIDARPSDAIAIALRTKSPIFVDEKVLEKSKRIDLRKMVSQEPNKGESEKWLEFLESLSPEDFGKYKM